MCPADRFRWTSSQFAPPSLAPPPAVFRKPRWARRVACRSSSTAVSLAPRTRLPSPLISMDRPCLRIPRQCPLPRRGESRASCPLPAAPATLQVCIHSASSTPRRRGRSLLPRRQLPSPASPSSRITVDCLRIQIRPPTSLLDLPPCRLLRTHPAQTPKCTWGPARRFPLAQLPPPAALQLIR